MSRATELDSNRNESLTHQELDIMITALHKLRDDACDLLCELRNKLTTMGSIHRRLLKITTNNSDRASYLADIKNNIRIYEIVMNDKIRDTRMQSINPSVQLAGNKTQKVHVPLSDERRTNNKQSKPATHDTSNKNKYNSIILSDDECIHSPNSNNSQMNKNKIKNNESQFIPQIINNNNSKGKQKPKEIDDSNQKRLSPIDQIAKCQDFKMHKT